jgi:hypothetical protein
MTGYETPENRIACIERENAAAQAERDERRKREAQWASASAAREAREPEARRKEIEAETAQGKAAAKEKARREYPFPDASFEEAWLAIRVQLAAEEIARKRNRVASAREIMQMAQRGSVGGYSPPTFGPIDR